MKRFGLGCSMAKVAKKQSHFVSKLQGLACALIKSYFKSEQSMFVVITIY